MLRLSSTMPKHRKHRASGCHLGKPRPLSGDPFGTKISKQEYVRLVGEWLAAGCPIAQQSPVEVATITEIIGRFGYLARFDNFVYQVLHFAAASHYLFD